jgi:PBSX family phage terminase large subunit
MTYQDQSQVKLTDLIAPSFYGIHWDIVDGNHTYYDLYGGRGSTKSSFVGLEIVLGMMEDPNANAIVYRKVGNTIGDSVFEQILWAIDVLEVNHLWKCTTSPYRCMYKPTKQRIVFKGLDEARKSKSAKVSKGYFKYLWFEELDEFSGMEEIRTVEQSILRGGPKFVVFKTFNPPISVANWANKYVQEPHEDSLRCKSDYTTVPVKWLGGKFVSAAEHLKRTNPKAYEHEYLGNPVGLGTNIFEFLEIRTITDAEIAEFDRIYQGVDWGFYPDAYAFTRMYYNHNQERIYILDENYCHKQRNVKTGQWILDKHYDDYVIMCDNAENKSVDDYRDMGIPARAVTKGPGSVEYGMKWLQSRYIVIDPARTPNAYKEFTEYEFETDGNGNVISRYPDKNNHTIDSVRYGMTPLIGRRGNSA